MSMTYPPVASLDGLARGVLAILKEEGVDMVNLVGSSLGGYLAQYIVTRYPEVVEKAVFGNTFPPNERYRREHGRTMALARFMLGWLVMRMLRRRMVREVLPVSGDCEALRM